MNRAEYPAEIRGSKVLLRDFRMDDVDAVLEIAGDDRVTEWLSYDSKDRDQVEAMVQGAIERAQLEPRQEWYLAVTHPDTDRLIGFARLAKAGVQAGKLGYAIRYDEQGKGYVFTNRA